MAHHPQERAQEAVVKDRKIASLDHELQESRSLWRDSLARLARNRLAIIGLVVIIINILIAVFADRIAPYHYAEQQLELNNAAPMWVIDMFPIMEPRREMAEQTATVFGATIPFRTGDFVEAGEIVAEFPNQPSRNVIADFAGTVFLTPNDQTPSNVTLLAGPPTLFPRDDGAELLIPARPAQRVAANDPLLTVDGETITAPGAGFIYLQDDRLVFRPTATAQGYVTVTDAFPLGADHLGRDLLSRMIYGARVSLSVAFIGPLFATFIGVTMGLIAGYVGGVVDNIIMRIVDIFYAFPTLLLIILLMAYFRSGVFTEPGMEGTLGHALYQLDRSFGGLLFIIIGISITSWVNLARLTRGQVLSVRENEYITAAEALGASRTKIMARHVLPNILGPLIVAETLTIPTYIRIEAFLSFIGLGVNRPTPSWGQMISDGANALSSYPNQAIFPAIALFFIMFAFNFLGDGLRDALDPRMRGQD